MGDLLTRIMQIRVFDIVRLDYTGPLPFYTKCAHKISVAKFRSYICLFIWTATNLIQKAVHLDLMSGYFTACFLSALHRLIYIKGCPSKVVCDNGPNFKGVARHLMQLFLLCRKKVQDFSCFKGNEWFLFLRYIPDFGGLLEAIKSTKQWKRKFVPLHSLILKKFILFCYK